MFLHRSHSGIYLNLFFVFCLSVVLLLHMPPWNMVCSLINNDTEYFWNKWRWNDIIFQHVCCAVFLFTGILPCGLLLLVNIRYPETWITGIIYRLISMFASLLIIFVIAFFFYKDYASVGRNNFSLNKEIIPTNYIYSGFKYVRDFFLFLLASFVRLERMHPAQ